MSKLRILRLLPVALVLAGCFGDDDGDGAGLDLDNVWPHADGSAWTYALDVRLIESPDGPLETDLPSMETLHARLQEPVDGTVVQDTALLYVLEFDGETTTDAGVTAQHLVEQLLPLGPGPQDGTAWPTASRSRRLLRFVAAARPELQEAIAGRLGRDPGAKDFARVVGPVLLGGGAFAYEDSGYYGYGDLYRDHSWTYLEGELKPGRSFSLQLVAGLADDIWLHARIWSVQTRRLDGTRYANLLECMYVIDLGLQTMMDDSGEPAGSVRPYIYGTVWYAPQIGPVGCRERSHLMVRTAYEPEGTGEILTRDYECRLEGYDLPQE